MIGCMDGWNVRISVDKQWRILQETEGTYPKTVKMPIRRQCRSVRRVWASTAQDSIA